VKERKCDFLAGFPSSSQGRVEKVLIHPPALKRTMYAVRVDEKTVSVL